MFGQLDPTLQPRLKVMALRFGSRDVDVTFNRGRGVIPQDSFRFAGRRAYWGQSIYPTGPVSADSIRARIRTDLAASVVANVVDRELAAVLREQGLASCSATLRSEDHIYFVAVLTYATAPFAHVPNLTLHDRHEALCPSLVHAVCREFLEDLALQFGQPAGLDGNQRFNRTSDDLMRAGARRLLRLVGTQGQPPNHQLYEHCNQISALPYEGSPPRGQILITPHFEDPELVSLCFRRPVPMFLPRAARKALEMCDEKGWLLSDGLLIWGLSASAHIPNRKRRDHFSLTFSGLNAWELCYEGNPVLRVNLSVPSLPTGHSERETDLQQRLVRCFGEAADAETLIPLLHAASEQQHGTLVIIAADADAEAKRLATQGISVAPGPMTPKVMRHASRIDGAVLLDPTGACHAIGLILDGPASDDGDPGRGARFNSAVRYVAHRLKGRGASKRATLALIVSEDGTIEPVDRHTILDRRKDREDPTRRYRRRPPRSRL